MESALLHLLALNLRGGFRSRRQQLFSVHGMTYCVIACVVPLVIWFGLMQGSSEIGATWESAGHVELALVLGLVCATLLPVVTATSPAFHFSPEEMHFLQAGPFPRQSLWLYKILSSATGAMLTALCIAVFAWTIRGHFSASVMCGSFLSLLFIQLAGASIRCTLQLLSNKIRHGTRRRLHPAVSMLMIGAGAWLVFIPLGRAPIDMLLHFCDSRLGSCVLLPFTTLARVTLADRFFPDSIQWISLSIALNLGLLYWVLRVERLSEVMGVEFPVGHRARQSEQAGASEGKSRVLPALSKNCFPIRMAGIGPIVWRQLIHARHSAGTAILVLTSLGIAAGPLLVYGLSSLSVAARLGIVIAFAIFIIPKTMTFDFRGDGESILWLRGLPLRPVAIVFGQLAAPVLLTSGIELLLIIGMSCLVDASLQTRLVALVPFLLPFNTILYGIENAMYLLMPFRLLPTGRIDFEFFGRSLLENLVKLLVLSLVAVFAVFVGRTSSEWTGGSGWVYYSVSWIALGAIAAIAICLVTLTFVRSENRAVT